MIGWLWCWFTGEHKWSPWKKPTHYFPHGSTCGRCGTHPKTLAEYREVDAQNPENPHDHFKD